QTNWFKIHDSNIRKAIRSLNKDFNAFPHRDSEFVEISMTSKDAGEAADIVNIMLDLFIKKQRTSETAEVREKLTQLNNQKDNIERELRTAESALAEVRSSSGFSDLDTSEGRNFQDTVTLTLQKLEQEKIDLDIAIKHFQAELANIQQLATGPITEQIEYVIEKDTVMLSLAQQIVSYEAQLKGMLTRFGEDHMSVLQMRDVIEETKTERQARRTLIAEQTRRANLENARQGLIVLQQRFEELEKLRLAAQAKKKDLDEARVQYEQRTKIRDEITKRREAINEQIEKWTIIANDPETPKVQEVGLAPRPLEMIFSRQWWLWLPSGMMLGFMLGIGLAFLKEIANDLVRTPSDITKYLRIPLLGVVPDVSEDNQIRRADLCHAVRKAPYSFISESYRRCRTNLKLSDSAVSLKTLFVTSGMPDDGKTSTAVNLATAFVASGKKILLIDANFRQPNLSTIFPKVDKYDDKQQFDFGLSSVLMRQCTSNEAIRPSAIEGLDIIDCGPIPANPSELLSSKLMGNIFEEQRKKYDHIIIDGPPVLLVSDASILAGLTDATLLVFNATATSRGAAQRTIRELIEVNANIVGCVLLRAKSIKGGYFNEQYKSYRKYQKAQLAFGKR
ncbi:polysaccharide biosynthesis tyrosine autokinase, partial [Planctomycetota bacterium]